MAATCVGGAFFAIKSLTTGGFVRAGLVNCSKANTTAHALKIHFNFLFIQFNKTLMQ